MVTPHSPQTENLTLFQVLKPAWWADAACRGQPIRLFFPSNGGPNNQAKQLCANCPVIHNCDEWATSHGAKLKGMFAGRTEHDRKRNPQTSG